MARPNCRWVTGAPSKVKGWRAKYAFVRVPKNFPLKRKWAMDECLRDRAPNLNDEKEGHARALRGVPSQDAKFKKLMSDAYLRKASLLFHSGSLVVDDEGEANEEDNGPNGHESYTPMGGGSAASLSKGDEEEEGDGDHNPSPCREMSSRGRGDHPLSSNRMMKWKGAERRSGFVLPDPWILDIPTTMIPLPPISWRPILSHPPMMPSLRIWVSICGVPSSQNLLQG